jgi:hypothetical protein
MLPYDANISAYFLDVAKRHPDIQHDPSLPYEKHRFFEMEWDEMLSSQRTLSATHWTLVLEDYRERFTDNKGDYISSKPIVTFMVLKHVTHGKAQEKHHTWQQARRIAHSIIGKLVADQEQHRYHCTADVPAGVVPPHHIDISTLTFERVQPEIFDFAVGCRASFAWMMDHQERFSRNEVQWLPLNPTPAP